MPSSKKMNRILELNEKYDFDYFNNEKHKETIEIILADEFPDEVDRIPVQSNAETSTEQQTNNDEKVAYWVIGSIFGVVIIALFWKYILAFLILLIVIAVVGIAGIGGLFAGGGSGSSSSYSYKPQDRVTYALQRQGKNGAVWTTIAEGPENWMIDKLERQTDNARYRVVMLVNGKVSGTTYS